MCTQGECNRAMGQWVRFQTPWGVHRGVVESVNQQAVLVRVPRTYAPTSLTSHKATGESDDARKLDIALAVWGGGYAAGYGRRGWGYPGYGGWYGGWWWWWLAFAWIFWLAFLW